MTPALRLGLGVLCVYEGFHQREQVAFAGPAHAVAHDTSHGPYFGKSTRAEFRVNVIVPYRGQSLCCTVLKGPAVERMSL